ncbi:unnamed protein product [Cuscuta campestris]|uniref:Uncharacterized protein n=1 Tax=Cuscuta campestris TaxID=132261 RepID=A0A484MXP5_9ASTE|nr:unnamed protein product [Cuscuta campestris]
MEAFLQVISEAKADIYDIDGLCSQLKRVFPPASYFYPVPSGYDTLVEEFKEKEWGKTFDSAGHAINNFVLADDAEFLLRFIMGLLYFRKSNFVEAYEQFYLSDKLCRKLYNRGDVVNFLNLASHEVKKYWNDVENFMDQTTEMHAVLNTLFSKFLDGGGSYVSRALTSFKDERWKEAVVCVNLACAGRCELKKEYLDLCLTFFKGLLHYRRNHYARAYEEFLSCDSLCSEIFQSTFFESTLFDRFIAFASNGIKNLWDSLEEHINQTDEMHKAFVVLFCDILDGNGDKNVDEALTFFKKENWRKAAMSVLKAIEQRGQKQEYFDLILHFFYCVVSNQDRKKDLVEKHFQICLELKTRLSLPFPSGSFFKKKTKKKQKVPGEVVPPSSTSASTVIAHNIEDSNQVPRTDEPLLSSQSLDISPKNEESVQVIGPEGETESRISRLAKIEKLVLGQIEKQEYDKALAFIKTCFEQCTGDSREKEVEQCVLYELRAMVYINNEERKAALMEASTAFEIHKKYGTFFKCSEVADIFGEHIFAQKELGSAINFFEAAVKHARKENWKEKFKTQLDVLQEEYREHKRESKCKSANKKASFMQNTIESASEVIVYNSETSTNQTEGIKDEVSGQKNEFDIILKCTRYSTALEGLRGLMKSCGSNLPVMYVPADYSRLTNFKQLRDLCCSHDTLLSIIHLASIPSTSYSFILTEPAHVLDVFFSSEAECLWSLGVPKTPECWWSHIAPLHQSIFRDIAHALLFLYSRSQACGQLAFNAYVTDGQRGKILPSMAVDSRRKHDLHDFVMLMKSVILHPFPEATLDDFPLPLELKRFFSFIGVKTPKRVPVWYQIDHPYFWTVRERISFVHRFKAMMSSQKILYAVLDDELCDMRAFDDWADNLQGVYKVIWEKWGARGLKKKTNSEEVQSSGLHAGLSQKGWIDIVSFARTLYIHINEREYDHLRGKCACRCFMGRTMDDTCLKKISPYVM